MSLVYDFLGGFKRVFLRSLSIIFFFLVCNSIPHMLPGTVYAGQVTLSWDAPVLNEDGTPLTDLAGFRIHYGPTSGNYLNSIDVGNVTIYQVDDLIDGVISYFAVTAYDTSGNESDFSYEVSKIAYSSGDTITAIKTVLPIMIDGVPDEEAWNKTDYITFTNPVRSDNQVIVYALWDDDNLYFAYDVKDSLLETMGERIWRDDGAEIFLDTDNTKTPSMDFDDYHFIINIDNHLYVPGIASEVAYTVEGYTMEIAIPWSTILTTPYSGKIMGLLLANNDMDNGASSQFDWLDLIETGPFARPNLWGNVILSGQSVY